MQDFRLNYTTEDLKAVMLLLLLDNLNVFQRNTTHVYRY